MTLRLWLCGRQLGACLCVVMAACALVFQPRTAGAEEPPVLLLKWGTGGFGDGQFVAPYGIAVSTSGFVYVVDASEDRVQKFTTDSVFVSKWGTTGSGPGQFDNPIDVAVDPMGNVYISDLGNGRIEKFDANGTFLTDWGGSGSIGADPAGSFVLTASGNTIRKYTTNGVMVSTWTYGVTPVQTALRGMGVGPDGTIYVAAKGDNVVLKIASDGSLLAIWGSLGSGDNEFDSPYDVAVDGDGNVYVSDIVAVRKFTAEGVFLTRWGDVLGGSGPGEFNGALGIAIDTEDSVYVLDTGNYRVQKFGEAPTPAKRTTWGRIKAIYR